MVMRHWQTDTSNRNIVEQICWSETLVIRDIHDHTYTGEQAVTVDTGDHIL